jgi:hypothetical protein
VYSQAQEQYFSGVAQAQRLARDEKGRKEAKEARLRTLLQAPRLVRVGGGGSGGKGEGGGAGAMALPMPLDPSVRVRRVASLVAAPSCRSCCSVTAAAGAAARAWPHSAHAKVIAE